MASYAVQGVTGNLCFIAGTLVLCMDEDGNQCHKPIEDVKVGDMVWAYDEETGENAWKPVVRLFRNQTKEWYHVFVDGEEIVCTAKHPFYVVDKGFIEAKYLKPNDKLLLSSGKEVILERVEVEKLETAENTYNFEVADFHTYYVTENNVLVHNKCRSPYDYLDDALEQNGYTRKDIPDLINNKSNGVWSHKWSENGVEYRLWMHKGNPQFTNANYIFRVQSRASSGQGWKLLGANGRWYPEKYVKPGNPAFKNFIARITHIHIP